MDNKIITNNIPILDELVHYLKRLAIECIIKEEEKALNNETIESAKKFNVYAMCVEGRARFDHFEYSYQDFKDAGTPDSILIKCYNNPELTPENIKRIMEKRAIEKTLNNYEELNDYYRCLNGLPYNGQESIYVTEDMIPEELRNREKVDLSLPLHKMNDYELNTLEVFGVMNIIRSMYSDLDYLNHLGYNSIDPYIARRTTNYSILYAPKDIPVEVLSRFKEKYERNRVYTLKCVYSEAYKYQSDYYENFIQMFIMVQTIVDILSEMPDMIIKREFFDLRTVRLVFQSNGIDTFDAIPFKYQLAMIKNLNRLIKYKSTTKNIVDICSLFGFDNIQVFKYYLLKERKMDSSGNYIYSYTKSVNSLGLVENIENIEEEYKLKFVKVPVDELPDSYLGNTDYHVNYDEMTLGDQYWDGDKDHESVRREILSDEFNYLQSKYLSIDTIYDMTKLSFETTYFYNMIFDNHEVEDYLMISLPTINNAIKFKFVDVICYLFALMYINNKIEDRVMDSTSKIMHVMGFNFKANMEKLNAYIKEKGFTPEELGISDFQIPSSYVLSYNQLLNIFTKNKAIYEHVKKQMYTANNKEIYDIYETIFNALMITELTDEFFTKSDGTVAKTYTEFLKDRDTILYKSIEDIKAISKDYEREQTILDIVDNVVYSIEEYIDTDEYKFIFSRFPSVSAEAVTHYIYKVIDFFKSYKVQIYGINTIYKFDDRLDNKIKMIDTILIQHNLTKATKVKLIEKMRNRITKVPKDYIDLDDKMFIDPTYWTELFFTSDAIKKENIFKAISFTKKDDIRMKDTVSITSYNDPERT